MEKFNELKPDLLSATGLQVDEESGNHLRDAGQWAKAIAVIASIIIGLATLSLLAFGSLFIRFYGFGLEDYAGILVAVLLVVVAVALIGIVNLFRFSNGITAGVNNQDGAAFDKGISGLKIYFILIGIFTLLSTLVTILKLITE